MKLTDWIPMLAFAMSACTGFAFSGRSSPDSTVAGTASTAATGQGAFMASLELQDIQYDGLNLSGRLLVGALNDGLRLDKRLRSNIHVNVDSVRDCAEREVPYVIMDYCNRSPGEDLGRRASSLKRSQHNG
jgi:hypothetical protein